MLQFEEQTLVSTALTSVLKGLQTTCKGITQESIENLVSMAIHALNGECAIIPDNKSCARLLSTNETATFLNVSKRFIWRLVKEGRLTPIKIGVRARKFAEDEVLKCAKGFNDLKSNIVPVGTGRPKKNVSVSGTVPQND